MTEAVVPHLEVVRREASSTTGGSSFRSIQMRRGRVGDERGGDDFVDRSNHFMNRSNYFVNMGGMSSVS